MSWNRAARTDKGVHAAGQVVSLRMNMHESKAPAFVAALNAAFPPELAVRRREVSHDLPVAFVLHVDNVDETRHRAVRCCRGGSRVLRGAHRR